MTQRRAKDCGIASLATLLGVPYDDANDAILVALGRRLGDGVWTETIIKAAKHLGRTLRRKRKVNLDIDRGVLCVDHATGAHALVLLGEGVVFDPEDGMLWDADDYLSVYKATANVLLVLKEP